MSKIIFVNDTAATEGGALTILKQFLNNINFYSNKNYVYYVFCSLPDLKLYENEQIKIINDVMGKKRLDRIKWDLYGLKFWSKNKNIKANLIISFQNTGCRYFSDVRQLIYLHQPLPFYQDKKWSLFNKNEKYLWFYQNIYKKIIQHSLNRNSFITVQTEIMKKKVIEQFYFKPDKITVIKPSFENIDINQTPLLTFNDNRFHIFYPASTVLYKNHEVIIKGLKYIKDKKENIFRNLLVHFTFDNISQRNLELIQLMNKLEVNSAIKLEGTLPYDGVLSLYKSCDLMVFPSYIETFGLPLIEAASFGLPILVSDLSFSREVIGDYEGAKFLDYNDYKIWGDNIVECYEKRLRFKPYVSNRSNNWEQFFKLVDKLLL